MTPEASRSRETRRSPRHDRRYFWGHGAEDRVIAATAIARTAAYLPQHATLRERVYPGMAHGISGAEVDDVCEFVMAHVGAHAVSAR